jgi:hypothetical protein
MDFAFPRVGLPQAYHHFCNVLLSQLECSHAMNYTHLAFLTLFLFSLSLQAGKGNGKGGKGGKGKGGSLLSAPAHWDSNTNEVSVDEALPTTSRNGIAWPSEADEPLQPPPAAPKPKTAAKAAQILAKHSVVATSEVRSAFRRRKKENLDN